MEKRHTSLSVKEKICILNEIKNKVNKRELCEKYRCNISTINRILKNKRAIKNTAANGDLQRKRQRKGVHENVENALRLWFDQQREMDVEVTNSMLLNKAKEFSVSLNDEFEPSSNWLFRWRKRNNINQPRIHKKGNDNDAEDTFEHTSNILPDIIDEYEPENIFNADESGLFYKALPKVSFVRKCDQPFGSTNQKARLTLLFLCNATGNYKKIFVVGQSKSPLSFRNTVTPLPYFSNEEGWMTIEIWNEIILSLDEEMRRQRRSIILFVDNATCHKLRFQPKNIVIKFLPSNIKASIQPLHQGIISEFKTQYRKFLIKKQLLAFEREVMVKEFLKSISILDAISYIKRAWDLVKQETISNCFKKVGFICADETVSTEEEVDDLFLYTFESICDDDIPCYRLLNDEEIVKIVDFENQEIVDDVDSPEDTEENSTNDLDIPTMKEALCALDTLQRFCVRNNMDDIDSMQEIERKLFKQNLQSMRQSKIRDYFA